MEERCALFRRGPETAPSVARRGQPHRHGSLAPDCSRRQPLDDAARLRTSLITPCHAGANLFFLSYVGLRSEVLWHSLTEQIARWTRMQREESTVRPDIRQCAGHVHATGSPRWDGSGGIRAPESSVGGERPEFPDSCWLPSTAATTMAAPGRTKGSPATERRPRYALVKRRLSLSPLAGSASLDRMSFAGARHDDCIMAFFCWCGPRCWCAYRFSARASTIGARGGPRGTWPPFPITGIPSLSRSKRARKYPTRSRAPWSSHLAFRPVRPSGAERTVAPSFARLCPSSRWTADRLLVVRSGGVSSSAARSAAFRLPLVVLRFATKCAE